MSDPGLHGWNLSPAKARSIQVELASRINLKAGLEPEKVQRVLSVDVSMNRFSNWLTAAVVVSEIETRTVIEKVSVVRPIEFPYVTGLLAFRELPAILEAIGKLNTDFDVVVVDGHGAAHPKGLGIASHLGLWLNKPTIGIAKSRLCGTFDELPEARGSFVPLIYQQKKVGYVLRTRLRAKPVFVSAGHMCSHEEAMTLTLRLLDHRRIAWPMRAAHDAANAARCEHAQALQAMTDSA